jgi:hypothetical protein
MLDKFSYLFIVGAGAGKPYGLPTGKELYLHLQQNCHFTHGDWAEAATYFMEELRLTSGVSIDKYININAARLKDIGVLSIAAAIHFYETQSCLSMPPRYLPNGDWMTYLFEKMHRGLNTPEDLLKLHDNNHVAFITFNYDRSLEHFLFSVLWGLIKNSNINIHNETQWKAVTDVIKQIPIIHVYGKIGKLPWEDGRYEPGRCCSGDVVSYGHEGRDGSFAVLARRTHTMIDLIYEERKDNPEIENAKKLISNSKRIFFLGFGYDENNLSILNLPGSLSGNFVVGTALHSTENERQQIRDLFRLNFTLRDCDCLTLLREYL